MYITQQEYESLGFGTAPQAFDEYLRVASNMIDYHTRYFYLSHDLTEDNTQRAELFKKAVASQVKYFDELGTSSQVELESQPSQITIGRTSVSTGSNRSNSNTDNTMNTVKLSDESYRYLAHTGLLYRGL